MICLLGGLLVSSLAIAQSAAPIDALRQDLQRCRAIAEANVRLACFDALAAPPVHAKAAASSAPTVASTASATATASPAPAASATDAATASFGLEHRTSASAAEELHSRIPGPFTGWEPKTRWKLANGQVWQVADSSRAYYRLESPAVRITRGALGSFFMEISGVSHAVPVRRVE